MKLYDERDDFNFHSVNFPFMPGTISAAPADGIYLSTIFKCVAFDKWNIFVVIVTQIYHNGQPSHGGDRNIFEVMTSPLPTGYIPLIESTPWSFTHSRLIIGCATILTRRVPLMNQDSTDPFAAPEFTPLFSGAPVTRPFAI
jgi:hypothetical protein